MTDKELLELAAKAAKLDYRYDDNHGHHIRNANVATYFQPWNPLTDDGDALRLAVKLKITVEHWLSVPNSGKVAFGDFYDARLFTYGDNPYAATRRAIVRAAAEIGKKMS